MRLPLATDLKTRTGAPDKDARLKNCYVESKGPMNDPNNPPQTAVRKRPSAQGGIAVGTGIAQGGINGLFVYGDVLYPVTQAMLTTCNNATNYSTGDHVTVNMVDFWATSNTVNTCPTGSSSTANWSTTFVSHLPSHIYATWNPADSGAGITLSGGNLVVSGNGVSLTSIRSTIGKSAGKWYWEITRTSGTVIEAGEIGVCKATDNIGTYVGFNATGYAYEYSGTVGGSNKVNNNLFTIYDVSGYCLAGGVVGIALDMDTGTIGFYLNGVYLGVAFSGLTGTFYAALTPWNDVITTNFGASAFVYSPPAGFNSGLYI